MNFFSYLFPQTLLKTTSKYNKEIRVNREYGRNKLLVNGSRQSGAYIEMLWKKAFAQFSIGSKQPVRRILVLGVAGGTVIHILHTLFPEAPILGVDIDQVMIEIGKKYFDLRSTSYFFTIKADAHDYVEKAVGKKENFDLIIVDLFSGRVIPDFVSDQSFLTQLKLLMPARGMLVINYLQELEYGKRSDALSKQLQGIFGVVKDIKIERNRFFFASFLTSESPFSTRGTNVIK